MKTKKKTKTKLDEVLSKPWILIVENDDINTFDWVIICLMRICGHTYEQAAQCANIVHNNGSCDVKYGEYDELSIMKDGLLSSGISAKIIKNT